MSCSSFWLSFDFFLLFCFLLPRKTAVGPNWKQKHAQLSFSVSLRFADTFRSLYYRNKRAGLQVKQNQIKDELCDPILNRNSLSFPPPLIAPHTPKNGESIHLFLAELRAELVGKMERPYKCRTRPSFPATFKHFSGLENVQVFHKIPFNSSSSSSSSNNSKSYTTFSGREGQTSAMHRRIAPSLDESVRLECEIDE